MESLPPPDSVSKQYAVGPENIELLELRFPDKAEALYPLEKRFVFWTPAILYLWGNLNQTILSDFLNSYNQEVTFYYHVFNDPLFVGLTDREGNNIWNHMLWAVDCEHWAALLDHLCSVTLTNTNAKSISKYAMQEVFIVDPICRKNITTMASLPGLTVRVMGVRSDKRIVALDCDPDNPLVELPRLRFYDADEECKMYAHALFDRNESPESITEHLTHFDTKENTDGS